jgi:soluble lytic murein transglycosylase-like protein
MEKIARVLLGVDPAQIVIANELTVLKNHPPVSEKRCASALNSKHLSVHGKKGESLFHPIIIQAANRHQVDPNLVKAVIMAESGYNPRAVSKSGARGLMQLMPRTAKSLGVEDSFDPSHNINGGVRYLRQLLNQFDGNVKLALAAYNAGCGNVRKYRGIPPFKATKFYVRKVFEYYQNYKEHLSEELDRA